MSKKNFRADIATGADRFFSVNDTQNTQDTETIENTNNTEDTLDTKDTKATYRINLKLRADHKEYLADEAWRQRISVTELLNRMIDEYKERNVDKA